MQSAELGKFHVDLGEASEVSGTEVPAAMETEGPITEVFLPNGHPNTINVA